ncbi:SMC5-SMC6 complex localization factor protein 2 isoform X4 [Nerophis lumbriciformis]|uniref:SMC5-SMC6 complex localization factor protein 2 isoform X4 n=1 Tax=Nerophis lumbriciformis TaxID=546530 RepID=UPI002ADFF659|nr:SMC5-SMC6 complex localization factor protein 2 isoform X4 [Nerophis lumbriciformis]
MKNGGENHGDTRTLKNATYYSPKIKETPMKPSQIANRLVAPPRRMLSQFSPDCQRNRTDSPCQPSYHLAAKVNSSGSRKEGHNNLAKWHSGDKPAPLHCCQSMGSTHVANKHDGRLNTSLVKLLQPEKDSSVRVTSFDSRKDHKSMTRSSTEYRPPSNKDQRMQMPSSEKSIPVSSSQKRHRESEDNDSRTKKLCLRLARPIQIQPPNPVLNSPHKTSQVSLLLHKIPDKPTSGQSTSVDSSSTFKQLSCTSPSAKPFVTRHSPSGAKQLQMQLIDNNIVHLQSFSKPNVETVPKRRQEYDKRRRSSTEVPQKPTTNSFHPHLSSPLFQHRHQSSSLVQTPSTLKQTEEPKKPLNVTHESKVNGASLSVPAIQRKKPLRRKTIAVSEGINDLFTPDAILSPVHKTHKTKLDLMSATTKKRHNSSVHSSAKSSLKDEDLELTCSANICMSSANHSDMSMSFVSLTRMQVENIVCISSKESKPDCPVPLNGCHSQTHKLEEKNKSVPNSKTIDGDHKQPSSCSQSPIKRLPSGLHRQKPNKAVDPLDEDLDFGLGLTLDLDSSQTSDSSDDQLISLQEIMNHIPKLPNTPEKSAFSEPSTPSCTSSPLKVQQPIARIRSSSYRNSLDQMLKEIHTHKKAKENEAQLRTACDEELLRIVENEDEDNHEEGISSEEQKLLQRFSLASCAFREVPPGEVVFDLEKFGQLFSQDSLQLRECMVKPQSAAQKTLLWSSPAQMRLHLNIGLFQEAYGYNSPCPPQVTKFLFKMMSVHSEGMVSDKMLQALCDIASSAAYNKVKNGSQLFNVWVPALADVTLVLLNMGVAFVKLFPLENLQPTFTEGDLLEDVYIQSEDPSSSRDGNTFPELNCNNIFKYLSYCMSMCPQAHSDFELLLLMTMVARVSLDTHFISLPSVESYTVLFKIVNNIRDWNAMLPRICQAFTDLTDDHHNMCLLVQLLPDSTRGNRFLRQHLSLAMISKVLDGSCQYQPTRAEEIQLSDLRPYVPLMKPSSLLRDILNASNSSPKKDGWSSLDQQAYYLCYSLLTLTNEASNFHIFPAHQKDQLLGICFELEKHVKCDIRESVKCLYRSKVKDLLTRIYTKWQMLLQQSKPLNCQLYDYWKPLPVETLTCVKEDMDRDGRQQALKEKSRGDSAHEEDHETPQQSTTTTS